MKSRKISLLVILLIIGVAMLFVWKTDGPDRQARKFYKKGLAAFEEKEYIRAEEYLKQAIEKQPAYAKAYLILGQVALNKKKGKEAVEHLIRATQINPNLTDAQLILGRIFLSRRMHAEATHRADLVLRIDPDHREAILLKASAALGQNRVDEAIALLHPLYDAGQNENDIVLLLARAYKRKEAYEQATAILESGIEKNPTSVPMHLQLASVHLQSGNPAMAQALMETVVELDPHSYVHSLDLARLYWDNKEREKVEECLQRALEMDPKEPARRIAIANFYLEKKEIDSAQTMLQQGIEIEDPGARLRLALGELLLKTGKAKEAVELFNQGLAVDPAPNKQERIHLKNALASIYLAAKDFPSAKRLSKGVLALEADNFKALIIHGKALVAEGDVESAIVDFKQVLQKQPGYWEGYLQLANAYMLGRKIGLAKDTLELGLRSAPDHQKLNLAMYRVCLKDKDYKKAEKHLLHLVETYPDAIGIQATLGDFYLVLNDEDSAKREYSEVLLKAPRSEIGYGRLARLFVRKGEHEKAIAQLRKGISLAERNQRLTTDLATLFLADKRYEDAIALSEERLKKNPEDAFAYNLKGITYTKMRKYKSAKAAFKRSSEIEPMWPEPGNNLAAVYLMQNKKGQAISHFETVLDRNPKNPSAYLTLGRLYEEKKQYDKAVALYENAVKKVPGFWSAANRLGFLLADQSPTADSLEKAEKLAIAAYKMKPGKASIIDTLGWIHYKKGENEQALQLYGKLIAASPADPIINYHMGLVLQNTGDTKAAIEKLKIAARSETDFAGRDHAKAVLKKLQIKG